MMGDSELGRLLELGDRAQLTNILGKDDRAPSEYCFANLYLFRARHRYRYLETPVAHIRGITYDGVAHALPLVPLEKDTAHELLESGVDCIFPLGVNSETTAAGLGLVARAVDADSDYWYEGSRVAMLHGAKHRRSQAKAYDDDHAPRLEQWGNFPTRDMEIVLSGWLSDVARPPDGTDAVECAEAIRLADALGLEGVLVRSGEGVPVAFLLASVTDDGTRVVHFAKGRRAHSAAYPWMFSRYAALTGATHLNFEQDLGNPGLAQSKRAYAPIARVPKFRLFKPS